MIDSAKLTSIVPIYSETSGEYFALSSQIVTLVLTLVPSIIPHGAKITKLSHKKG